MYRIFFSAFLLLLLPIGAFAAQGPASFVIGRSLLSASSSPGNAYALGASVVLTAPIAGDLSATGGSIVVAAPVSGDELLFAGSISSRASVKGDLRAFGGSIDIKESVMGDIVAFGLSVQDAGRAMGSVFITAWNTTLTNGSSGPVTIYGNNVSLAGDFAGNVRVVISGHLTIQPNTIIRGNLSYEAPETASIASSATILGGIEYKNASYLPDPGTSRILALVSVGFFLFARILGALILAGLFAGLFPKLGIAIVDRAVSSRKRSVLLTMLLGFAIFVVAPVLIILLMLTFVGIGLGLLLLVMYALIAMLALIYAGILVGTLFTRRFAKRETILWRDGVIGMLVLSLVTLVPIIGLSVVFLFTTFTAGALALIFFHFVFPREVETAEML